MAIVTPWSEPVKKAIGANLRVIQHGDLPESHCKMLQDFPIPLLELWHPSGPRVICTNKYAALTGRIHVLDAFMKTSASGRKMLKADKKRIEDRAKDLKRRMEELERRTEASGRKLH